MLDSAWRYRSAKVFTYLMISSRIGPRASLMTGVASGHSLARSPIHQRKSSIAHQMERTSISMVLEVPMRLKPILSHSGFSPLTLSACFALRGGASKCGVSLVRYPYWSGDPIVDKMGGMEVSGRSTLREPTARSVIVNEDTYQKSSCML